MSPRVIFRLLGPWALQIDDRILPKPATLKAQSLLGYLLMHPNTGQPREKLAGIFWPDADEDRGQRSLRTALWSLRRMLEAGWPALAETLATTRFDVRWVPTASVEIDAHQFETAVGIGLDQRPANAAAAFAALESAASYYRGPLLEGLYDDWCLNERYRLEERCLQVLEGLVARYEGAGRLRDGVAAAQRLLDMDPLREEMHRAVIRMLGAAGDRAGAARQFKRCGQILRDELGIEPDAETAAAYAATRLVGSGGPRRSAADAAPELPTAASSPSESGPRSGPGGSRTPLIGRKAQWEALVGRLSAVEAGTGHAVLVAAPAGCGKTRLLEELAARARWRSVRVLWGRCYEYERLLPYQPFAEALRTGIQTNSTIVVGDDLRGHVPGDAARASDAVALAALPAIWKQALVMLLPDWADRLEPDGTAAPRPGAEQSQVLEAISRLLQALARHQPLLLVIDDLHWAAESTLQLFHHIARGVADHPILLVGTYRPEDLLTEAGQQHSLPRVTRSLQALGKLETLQLEPFNQEQVLELVGAMAGVPAGQRYAGPAGAPAHLSVLADGLHRYAEGNPLFVLAAIEALRAAGMIREVAEANGVRWRIADAALASAGDLALPLPVQIRDLLAERLDRVSPEAREIARLAAVAGSEFDLAVLERVWGRGEDETLQAIDALLAARFFREGASQGTRDFSFTHHLYKELIYDALPKAARVRHHRRIAAAMEDVYGPQALASELALHFVRGDLPLRALHYAHAAGKRAASSYANDDALHYYSMALTLLTEGRDSAPPDQRSLLDVQRIDVLDARLALYRRLGRPREEDADVQEMLAGARAIGDRQRELLALVQRSSSLGRAGDVGGSLEDARAALALAGKLGDAGRERETILDLTSRAQAALGWALLLHDAYAEALDAFEQALVGYRALKQAVPHEDRGAALSGEAVTLGNIGWTHEHTGTYIEARRCYEQALAIYQAGGDRLGEANTTVYLGNICWFEGDLAQAQARYEAALALFEPIIYRRGEATCLRNLGLTHGRRGRLETALADHRRALALHEALEDPAGVAECRLAIADCHYLIGLHDEAMAGYERALALTRAAENKHGEAQSVFGLARVDRALGRPEQALARSTDARPLCMAIGYARGVAWCDREAGLANLELGRPGEACILLRAALDGFIALGEPSMRIAAEADLAAAYLAQGSAAYALTLAEGAATAVRAGDHGVDQPQAVLFTLAQAYSAVGEHDAARPARTEAIASVRTQAIRLEDPALRASFLKNVPINRTILAAVLDEDAGATSHAVG